MKMKDFKKRKRNGRIMRRMKKNINDRQAVKHIKRLAEKKIPQLSIEITYSASSNGDSKGANFSMDVEC